MEWNHSCKSLLPSNTYLPLKSYKREISDKHRGWSNQMESGCQIPSPLDLKSYPAVGRGVPFIAQASSSLSVVLSRPDSLLLFMLPHSCLTWKHSHGADIKPPWNFTQKCITWQEQQDFTWMCILVGVTSVRSWPWASGIKTKSQMRFLKSIHTRM